MVAVALLMFGAYTFGKKRHSQNNTHVDEDGINYVPLQGKSELNAWRTLLFSCEVVVYEYYTTTSILLLPTG